MKTSSIFEKLEELGFSDFELEIFNLLEESFTDLTPEKSNDYLTIDEYFGLVRKIYPAKEQITSHKLTNYIRQSRERGEDLLFLDGLSSLAKCLKCYGGKDNLKAFEDWFLNKINKIEDLPHHH
ncbi:hypothetical protein [Flagellimonas beolgyonensis]|jgi:hypothetical protein|uniref:hypothetical protein n=1 Tax=Flagellimonas beolgyonensis TaxID=864064 RepID=UPI000F8D6743|nr:hypothetical protein [Allomuricauda beolgyonensis]